LRTTKRSLLAAEAAEDSEDERTVRRIEFNGIIDNVASFLSVCLFAYRGGDGM